MGHTCLMDDEPDLGEVEESLRVMLDQIDAGVVTASDVQRAYLAGFADALAQISVHNTTV